MKLVEACSYSSWGLGGIIWLGYGVTKGIN